MCLRGKKSFISFLCWLSPFAFHCAIRNILWVLAILIHAILVYELREEIFEFNKEGGKCDDWVGCDLLPVSDYVRVGTQLLGLMWGALQRGR